MAIYILNPTFDGTIIVDDNMARPWGTVHDIPGVDPRLIVDTAGANHNLRLDKANAAGTSFVCGRIIFTFDTTTIPVPETIVSARIRIFTTFVNVAEDQNIDIVDANPASSASYVATDYFGAFSQHPDTTVASTAKLFSTITNGAYNDLDFAPAGFTYINKGGTTTLGIRLSIDHSALLTHLVPPTTTTNNSIQFNARLGANPPILEVTTGAAPNPPVPGVFFGSLGGGAGPSGPAGPSPKFKGAMRKFRGTPHYKTEDMLNKEAKTNNDNRTIRKLKKDI